MTLPGGTRPDGEAAGVEESEAPESEAPDSGASGSEAPGSDAVESAAPQPAVPEAEFRRTHPVTPLVSGWKIIAGITAAVSIQNITALIDEFTIRRLLIGLGILLVVAVLAVVLSALSWRFTSYAITSEGVTLRTGILNRSRRFAPREKIDSVSVERPLLARALRLAKVRVEIAGGGESHLDIALIASADADRIRREILETASAAPAPTSMLSSDGAVGMPQDDPGATGIQAGGEAESERVTSSTWDAVVLDGVDDGEGIARIPTTRLLHSMVRDVEFLLGIVALAVTLVVVVILLLWDEGPGLGAFVAMIPAVVAVPQLVFGRVESGWGFISRDTDSGLRMRRGLLNTRTDNVAAGRIQKATISQPWLWRSQSWYRASATVAGVSAGGSAGDSLSDGSLAVLPVGTLEELRLTLGHLLPPLGTEDDMATLVELLTRPARSIEGIRAPRRWQWIARRTEVFVLLPGYLVRRHGVLTRKVQLISRERIQGIEITQGPISRRCGLLTLDVHVAGGKLHAEGMPAEAVQSLRRPLEEDAALLRRYSSRSQWPQPVLRGAVA